MISYINGILAEKLEAKREKDARNVLEKDAGIMARLKEAK